MKIFQKSLMASEDVKSLLVSGKYLKDETAAEIHDGAVVAIGDLMDNVAYTGRKDHNIRKIAAPAATTDEIGFVDLAEISQGEIMGNVYKMGYKTAGLTAPAGTPVRVRKVVDGDMFFLGEENFDTIPAIGQYAIVAADATTLTVTDDISSYEGIYVKIEDIEALTQGTVATDKVYLCRAHRA